MLRRIANKIRRVCFPTEHELMVRKWREDGGDYKFRFSYELDEVSLVLDLGGYEGQWASDLFSRYPCRLMVFEPVRRFADQIEHRFRRNKYIQVMNFGLGGRSRTETIHVSADGSSVFGASSETEEIRIVDVQEWLAKEQISRVSLLKINIEGGEYELLERLIETRLIEGVDNIQVQFHDIGMCANLSWKLKRLQTPWFDGIGRNNIKPVRERSRDEESVTFGKETQEVACAG